METKEKLMISGDDKSSFCVLKAIRKISRYWAQSIFFSFLFFFFFFLGPYPQHMEVSRLGVKSEL